MNTANTAASSASTSATSASTSASNASKSEIAAKTAQAEAEKARADAISAVSKLTGALKYAGQVNNYSDLSDITKNKGDVWNIVNADTANRIKAGDNVVWNGTDWDNLSGTVDLSIYAEKTDYQKTITSATANGATITFNHKDGTTSTATVNNVASATAATNDAKGQKIDATYEKIADASNVHTSLQNSINSLSTGKQDKLTFDTTPTANSSNPVTSKGIKTALDTKLDKTGTAVSATKLQTARTISLAGDATGSANFDGSNNINISITVNESKHAASANYLKSSDATETSTVVRPVWLSWEGDNTRQVVSQNLTYTCSTKTLTATNFKGHLAGNADTATKATQDASGNVITDTYATKTEVAKKQDKLTFDKTPTANSSNPVTSDGIKTALDGKQNNLKFDATPTAMSTNPVTSGGVKTYVDDTKNTLNTAISKKADSTDIVQADWNVTDTSSKAYVKNKPAVVTYEEGHYKETKEWKSNCIQSVAEGMATDHPDAYSYGTQVCLGQAGICGNARLYFPHGGGMYLESLWGTDSYDGWHRVLDDKNFSLYALPKDGTAVKATADAAGNNIQTTYAKKSDLSSSVSTTSLTVTGATSVPTANEGNSSNTIASTEFVNNEIARKCCVSATAPTAPFANEIWFDIGNKLIKFYDGKAWVTFSAVYTTT